jgi:hypothetical protein
VPVLNARLVRPIVIIGSRIKRDINVNLARTDSVIGLISSLIVGNFRAAGLPSESLLLLSDGLVKGDVILTGAKIDGDIDMRGASFNGTLSADSLEVGGSLLMASEEENKASFKNVNLTGTKITGLIDMDGASIDGLLYADALQVDGDVGLEDARCTQKVVMVFAHVGSSLDLRGATLADVDLSGASVGGDLRLWGAHKSTVWTGKNGEPGALSLHNTHIANLADATDAWPAQG